MQEHLSDTFTGTSAELLDQLEAAAYPEGARKPSDWPKNARAVTSILKRNAPALRKQGWDVSEGAKTPRSLDNLASNPARDCPYSSLATLDART